MPTAQFAGLHSYPSRFFLWESKNCIHHLELPLVLCITEGSLVKLRVSNPFTQGSLLVNKNLQFFFFFFLFGIYLGILILCVFCNEVKECNAELLLSCRYTLTWGEPFLQHHYGAVWLSRLNSHRPFFAQWNAWEQRRPRGQRQSFPSLTMDLRCFASLWGLFQALIKISNQWYVWLCMVSK